MGGEDQRCVEFANTVPAQNGHLARVATVNTTDKGSELTKFTSGPPAIRPKWFILPPIGGSFHCTEYRLFFQTPRLRKTARMFSGCRTW